VHVLATKFTAPRNFVTLTLPECILHCSTGVQAAAQAGNGTKSRKVNGSSTSRPPPSGVRKASLTRSHANTALAAGGADLMDVVQSFFQGPARAQRRTVLSDTEEGS
jgi:hypothetical protein